jgi:anti-anti-sigma factor
LAEQPTTLVVTDLDHARVATVDGEVDVSTAADFRRALLKALDAGDLVIDLRACTFVDSAAITALVATAREAKRAGRGLSIVAPHGTALTVLELTGVTDAIPTFSDLDDALEALTRPSS